MMKRNIILTASLCLISIMILCSMRPVYCLADEVIASGECGPECSYTLTQDGTLTISGKGTITKQFTEDKEIGDKIIRIVISEGIEKVGDRCFERLWRYDKSEPWKEVVFPSSLQEIGDHSFFSLATNNIVLPPNLKRIDRYGFCQNYIGEEIVLPESVEYYGSNVFEATGIRKITFPSNMQVIPTMICTSCHRLETIVWPENVREIGFGAFIGCKLKEVAIPDSVEKVNRYAFSDCYSLKKITIGRSVKEIPKDFIADCTSLKTVVNNSGTSVPLDTLKGRRSWYVDGKKVSSLKPGRKAKAVYQSYNITYNLDGGRIYGKRPKKHTYCSDTRLPRNVKKKGYTFVGWNISAKNDWEIFPKAIPGKLFGDIRAKAIFKKYSVTSKNGRIMVTVKSSDYGKKGYDRDTDAYFYRYSENKDMSDFDLALYTAPYGKGLSKKLKKGKTYYVEITRYLDMYMEDSEDYEEPLGGWHCKRKVVIR